MRNLSFLFIAAICFLVVACKPGSPFKTAVQYNDFIIGEQSKVVNLFKEYTNVLQSETSSEDADKSLKKCTEGMKKSIDTLSKAGGYNGNEEFVNAGKKLFEFYVKTINDEYGQIRKLQNKSKKISEADQKGIEQIAEKIANDETPIHSAFLKAQEDFAKKNNIQLMPNLTQ